MPKAEPHFDALGLLRAVHAQDFGLRVSTNNPRGFRRILYQAMRAEGVPKVHIYQCRRSPKAFLLLKQAFGGLEPLLEETEDASQS